MKTKTNAASGAEKDLAASCVQKPGVVVARPRRRLLLSIARLVGEQRCSSFALRSCLNTSWGRAWVLGSESFWVT
jgi:hypothetical protein